MLVTKNLQVLRHVNMGEGHISFAGSGRDRLNHPQNPTVRHLLCPLLRLLQCFIVIIDIIQPTAKPWTQLGRIYDGLSKIDFCGKRLYSKNHLHNRNSAISLSVHGQFYVLDSGPLAAPGGGGSGGPLSG